MCSFINDFEGNLKEKKGEDAKTNMYTELYDSIFVFVFRFCKYIYNY
jgi:hypothetical protein